MESGDLGDDHDEVSGVGGDSTHSGLLRAALTRRSALLGIGAVTGVAAVDVGGFAYLGGWLRPGALTPSRFADGFEDVFGRHDGFRRNHAKGLSATGFSRVTGPALPCAGRRCSSREAFRC
jgi:hypothetical protein